MRVIGGEFRSRRIETMPGLDVRPTPDKLRETLFDILGPSIRETVFLDAYAGTGAVGIEALSRGAKYAIFIERNRGAADLIRKNLAVLGIESRARVIQGHAAVQLRNLKAGNLEADIVFLDPPYPLEREYRASLEALAENPPGLTIVQHSVRLALEDEYGPLQRRRIVRQGDNALSFY